MKPALLFVPGIYDTAQIFQSMCQYFGGKGYEIHTLTPMPNDGSIAQEQAAQQVQRYLLQYPTSHFILVGFSMGGIIARYFVQYLDEHHQVEKLITLGSPHYGTLWAYFSKKMGIQQLRFGSKFLQRLNTDTEIFQHVSFLSLWTPLDLMIVPSVSSIAPIAVVKKVWALTHPGLVWKRNVFQLIERFLLDKLT